MGGFSTLSYSYPFGSPKVLWIREKYDQQTENSHLITDTAFLIILDEV
ncbi:hypothetical protein VL20_593 [Microcystis panniformis FACHB-1757]|uniref:Uncharacterized protein n=1 Tax=Microcystis panniformis FACHB-1757 TaxID=1638788 RepID=A0A0K1RVL8_9CHRO|nr:hypothetical protein VL20_593 [Microcystis panniformis FACHB-1757]